MTDAELDLLERMWSDGVSLKRIVNELGYSKARVNQVIASDRSRFPYRRMQTPVGLRDMWVDRLMSGTATRDDVADALGVHPATVSRWVRRADGDRATPMRFDRRDGRSE